jgi:hypothetical protein
LRVQVPPPAPRKKICPEGLPRVGRLSSNPQGIFSLRDVLGDLSERPPHNLQFSGDKIFHRRIIVGENRVLSKVEGRDIYGVFRREFYIAITANENKILHGGRSNRVEIAVRENALKCFYLGHGKGRLGLCETPYHIHDEYPMRI